MNDLQFTDGNMKYSGKIVIYKSIPSSTSMLKVHCAPKILLRKQLSARVSLSLTQMRQANKNMFPLLYLWEIELSAEITEKETQFSY